MTKIITPNKELIIPGKNKKTEEKPLDITVKLIPDTTNVGKTKVFVEFSASVSWITFTGEQAAQFGFKLIEQGTMARVTTLTPVVKKEEEKENEKTE